MKEKTKTSWEHFHEGFINKQARKKMWHSECCLLLSVAGIRRNVRGAAIHKQLTKVDTEQSYPDIILVQS